MIPQEVRKKLCVRPGDDFIVLYSETGDILLRPIRRKNGRGLIKGLRALRGLTLEERTPKSISTSSGEQQDDATSALRSKLFELPSPVLRALFSGQWEEFDRPIRVWWNCTPPELAELPWELLACELHKRAKAKFSFVRGLPPDMPLPRVPVEGRLRLAFIHEPERTPDALKSAIEGLKPILDVVAMTEPPREALQQAAKEGFELIHLVTDGALSPGEEGLLYLRESLAADSKADELSPLRRHLSRFTLKYLSSYRHLYGDEWLLKLNDQLAKKLDIDTCSASELSAVLRGSRVTLLSLSTPKTYDTDAEFLHGILLPSVFRAFVSFASSPLPLPNIVAPLRACAEDVAAKFWSSFYSRLADSQSYSVEEATGFGLQDAPTALMALFLRQRLGREFTGHSVKIGDAAEEPNQANAKLEVARSLIEQLRAIDLSYQDIESRIAETPLVKSEVKRQTNLEEQISSLTQLEGE